MIKQAVIIADMTKNNISGNFNRIKPLNRLLGLSLLKRSILNACEAGVEHFIIVLGLYSKEIEKKISGDKQLKKQNIRIDCIYNENFNLSNGASILAIEEKVVLDENFFLFTADQVFNREILISADKAITQHSGNIILCVSSKNNDIADPKKNYVISTEGNSFLIRMDLNKFEFVSTGVFVLNKKIFNAIKTAKKEQNGDCTIYDGVNKLSPNDIYFHDIKDLFFQSIDSLDDFKMAEKKLLNSVRKATDGVIARNLNRYISLFISKYLLKVNAHPNVITVGNLIIGLMSAYFIAQGGYFYSLIGGLFFQLASIIDGCDGEVAKLTYKSSKYGAWFDTVCDNITYIAFLACLPFGLYRYHQEYLYVILGTLTFVSAILFVFLMIKYINKIQGGGSLVKIVKDIEADAVFDLTSATKMLNYVISKVAFMMRRDFFAFFFLLLCLVGFSFLIQWLALSVLIFACVYFYYYSRKQLKLLVIKQ